MNLFMAGNRGKWGPQLVRIGSLARSASIFIAPFAVVVGPLSTSLHCATSDYSFTRDSFSQSIVRLEKL